MKSPSSTDVTVVCIFSMPSSADAPLRVWDEPSSKIEGFTEEYVYRLKAAVEKHAGDVRFVCVTNHDLPGIDTIKLRHANGGWLDKLEIFYHRYPGPVLYLDLDVMLVSDIMDIIARLSEFQFAGIKWGSPSLMLDSSVMAFDGTQEWGHLAVCDDLNGYDNKMIFDKMKGSIQWLEDAFPNRIIHYVDTRHRNKDESVVVFNRYPRPHQVGWNHELQPHG